MTNHRIAACAAALLLGTALGAAAQETYTNYDQFTATRLGTQRWGSGQLEQQRTVEGNVLRMKQREVGLMLDNLNSLERLLRTDLRNPTEVTQMRSTVRLNAVETSLCAANVGESSGGVGAGVGGTWFNVGPATPGSAVNDVRAFMYLARPNESVDAPGTLVVGATVAKCLDAGCTSTATLSPELDFGTVAVGTNIQLQVEWDPDNDQFLFRRDSQAKVAAPYTVSDSAAASVPWKALFTLVNLQNCLSGPRTAGYVDAQFDSLAVNLSAVP
jgi:hypothetical protein